MLNDSGFLFFQAIKFSRLLLRKVKMPIKYFFKKKFRKTCFIKTAADTLPQNSSKKEVIMATITRTFAVALPLLFIASFANGQQNSAERSLIKSFNLGTKTHLEIDLPGAVEIKTWDNETVRFQITLSLPNGNAGMLDELIKVGRYNLASTIEGDVFAVDAPNLSRKITIKGQELKENIRFTVFVPAGIDVKTSAEAPATAYIRPIGN